MKKTITFVCILLMTAGLFWVAELLSVILFHSRIERLGENDPKIALERSGTIYCRMKADDFRFPLPSGSQVLAMEVTTGGFDWAEGSVQLRFENSNHITPASYDKWLSKELQAGAKITTESVSEG